MVASQTEGYATILFGLLALSISTWIFWKTSGAAGIPGCSTGSSCDAVTRGRWSKVGRFPVALLGVAVYAVLSGFAMGAIFGKIGNAGWLIGDVVAVTVIAAAAWFLILQAAVIRRLCIYCTVTHGCASIAASCLLAASIPYVASIPKSVVIAGMVPAALLIIAQIAMPPRLYALTTGPVANGDEIVRQTVPNQWLPNQTVRAILLLRDQMPIAIGPLPIIGQKGARQIIGWLFDHSCAECHRLHGLIRDAVAQRTGRLAVVAIPAPAAAMAAEPGAIASAQDQSSQLARVALALWTIDPAIFDEWDQFAAGGDTVRTFEQLMFKAQDLADLEPYVAGNGLALLNRLLGDAVAIARRAGNPKLPTLILPNGLLTGRVPDTKTLLRILDEQARPVADPV